MKYDIIKSFKGSPDGRHAVQYNEGDKDVELTASLAEVAQAEGWAQPAASEKQTAPSTEASLTEEIAALEKSLATAAKKAKPAIEAELKAKQEALASLQADADAAKKLIGEEAYLAAKAAGASEEEAEAARAQAIAEQA